MNTDVYNKIIKPVLIKAHHIMQTEVSRGILIPLEMLANTK